MLLKTVMCRYSLMEKLVDCLDPNRGNDWFPLPFLQAMQCIGMQHPASWLQFPETGLSINKKPDHFLKRTRHADVPCVTASCHVRVRLDSFSSALEPNEGKHKNLREKAKANQPTNQKSSTKTTQKPHSHYICSFLSLNIIPLGSRGWNQGSTRHSWMGKSISWAVLNSSFLLLTRMFKKGEKGIVIS